MRTWEIVRVALEGIRRTPLRIALTAAGVAIATGALLSMIAFAEGVRSQAERPFDELDLFNRIDVWADDEAGGRRHRDRRPPEEEKTASATTDEDAPKTLDDAVLERLQRIPGVALAYPEMTKAGLDLERGEKKVTVVATSLPREAAGLPFVARIVTAGRFFSAGEGREVLLGKEVAEELGFARPEDALGEEIAVTAMGLVPIAPMGFRFDKQVVTLEVVGVWSGGWIAAAAGRTIVVPTDVMRTLPGIAMDAALAQMRRGGFGGGAVHGSAVVRVNRPGDVPAVEKEIKAIGLKTRTIVSQMESMRTFFVVLDVLLGAVGTVALIVAGLGIVNTLLMAVLERTREIGTFKAIGASDGDVRLLFLAEAGLVGLLGGLGGLVLGRVVSWGIGLGVGAYARSKGVEEAISVFAFPWWLVVGSIVFAVAASVISGVYPASRAARIDPIRALRGE